METTYKLLDFGFGKRLEQWGLFRLVRPDPTAIGTPSNQELWKSADAVYEGEKGKGEWKKGKDLPEHWPVTFDDISLCVRLAPYKHTGVFPEQMENWAWIRRHAPRKLTVLNLFAYTGGATMSLAKDGHRVTHVDSSKPAIGWAKENASLNHLAADDVRWIFDDAADFVRKEVKRGKTYDAIVLDPPAFGHSPTGKAWRAERDLPPLLALCAQLLSANPAFIVLNGYAAQAMPYHLKKLFEETFAHASLVMGSVETKELCLTTQDGRSLSTGVVARCVFP